MESNVGMAENPSFGATKDDICGFMTSADTKSWSRTDRVANGVSPYGIQMANFRGELYGIMTGQNTFLYANKYKSGKGWKSFIQLPAKYKSAGRVGVAVLQDRFYVAYRGTKNNKIYLLYTYDFKNWTDLGEFSAGGLTLAAPAIAGYDGKIYAVCVGTDKNVYWALRQGQTHALLQKWGRVSPGIQSYSALSMTVHHSSLYLFHTGLDNKAMYGQTIAAGSKTWTPTKKIPATITSGPSAVTFKNDRILISYRGANSTVVTVSVNTAMESPLYNTIPNKGMMYQTGLATFGGLLFLSYGVQGRTSSYPSGENEKMEFTPLDESDDEWDCKWNQDQSEGSWKSKVRKLVCM